MRGSELSASTRIVHVRESEFAAIRHASILLAEALLPTVRTTLVAASSLCFSVASACWAQPAWEPSGPWPDDYPGAFIGHDPREGRIEATQFVAKSPAARTLGQGAISVASGPDNMTIGLEDESFRAAVAEQLGKIGYTMPAGASGTQLAEVSVRHALVQPPEPPHSPVAGGLEVGGGNRGSGVGVAIALDFSKPLKALIATRLEARIRDSATKEILWEGHAEVLTREGDKHWTTQALASRLAAALFKGFPHLS